MIGINILYLLSMSHATSEELSCGETQQKDTLFTPQTMHDARTKNTDRSLEYADSKIPIQFFYRTLHLIVDHRPRKEEYVPGHRYKQCISPENHKDDDPNCVLFIWRTRTPGYYRVIESERTMLHGEYWSREDPHNLFAQIQNNKAIIIKTICEEGPSSKIFYGHSFYRSCWREKVIVALLEEKTDTSSEIPTQFFHRTLSLNFDHRPRKEGFLL